MTSVESAFGFPSADFAFRFPDSVGLDDFFTRLNHTARVLTVYASPSGRPYGARLASGCAFGLGRAGLFTRGDSFRGFSSLHPPQLDVTGAPGSSEGRKAWGIGLGGDRNVFARHVAQS